MAAQVKKRISARMPERACTVIEDESIIRLDAEAFRRFLDAIENPPAPNEKLLAAVRAHRDQR